jgi:DNA-binding GntR family transcriptional regulator
MATDKDLGEFQSDFDQLREVRTKTLEHFNLAKQYAEKRRDLMRRLLEAGLSQADLARELGVSRQAVQKMLAL